MAKDYFPAYHRLRESLKPFGDAEVGRLFLAALAYSEDGELPEFRGSERFIWPTLKQMIDEDRAAYDSKCKQLRANASKSHQKQANATNCSEQREESEKEERPKETPQKKSSPPDPLVKENTPEKYPGEERGREEKLSARVKSAAEEAFDMFWAVYPKKVGKKDAFKAFQKVPSSDYPLLIPAVEQQKQSRQWQSEGGRFIPNPSTWLNQGRWLDEGLDAGFNAPRKNRVAQELDDFYDMAREWAEEQKARAAGDV